MIITWKNNRQKAMIYLVLASLLWSSGGLFIKLIPWHPLAIAGARSLIASMVLFFSFRPANIKLTKAGWCGAVFYALTIMLFVCATKLTTAANAIILQYTAPIFVALFGGFVIKEKVSRDDWAAIIAVFAGLTLFFGEEMSIGSLTGNILGVLSGVCLAFFVLFMRKQKDGSPFLSVLTGNVFTFIFGLPFYFEQPFNINVMMALLFLGVFQLGLSYVLYSLAIKYVSALEATLITMIEPLLSPVWVFLSIGETPSSLSLVGGIIILFSIVGKYFIKNSLSRTDSDNCSDRN